MLLPTLTEPAVRGGLTNIVAVEAMSLTTYRSAPIAIVSPTNRLLVVLEGEDPEVFIFKVEFPAELPVPTSP